MFKYLFKHNRFESTVGGVNQEGLHYTYCVNFREISLTALVDGHQVQYGCVAERGMCCWCGLGAPGANLNVAAVSVQISSIPGPHYPQYKYCYQLHHTQTSRRCRLHGRGRPAAWHELTCGSREAGAGKKRQNHSWFSSNNFKDDGSFTPFLEN